MADISFEEFCYVHEYQIYRTIAFPKNLIEELYKCLKGPRNNDLNEYFEIRKFKNSRSLLIAKKDMSESSCFFVIDHIWTVDSNSFLQQLKKSPKLAESLAELFNIWPPNDVQALFNHSSQADVLKDIVTDKQRERIEEIVDRNNGDTIQSAVCVLDDVDPDEVSSEKNVKEKDEKCTFEEFKKAMESTNNIPQNSSDAYLMKLYENFLKQDHGQGTTLKYNWLEDENGIVSVYLPIPITASKKEIKSILTNTAWSLEVEGKDIISGSLNAPVKQDESFWSIDEPGLLCMSLQKVNTDETWPVLIKNEEQLSAKEILLKSWAEEANQNLYLEEILDEMWRYNQTYCKQSEGPPDPKWYIMDKYGSALIHDRKPNFCCLPFFYSVDGKAYSLLWPIKDVKAGTICTRDFMPQYSINYKEGDEIYETNLKAFTGKNLYKEVESQTKEFPETKLKMIKVSHVKEEEEEIESNNTKKIYLKIFSQSEIDKVSGSLKDFEILEKEAKGEKQLVSIYEASITLDGDLCSVQSMLDSREFLKIFLEFSFEEDVVLLPKSYHMPYSVVDFNKDFESCRLQQYWVVKPVEKKKFNVKTFITSQYSRIVRTAEACAVHVSEFFLHQPLFRKRRFALTYNILITPSRKVFIYKEPFIRMTSNESEKNALPREYDTTGTITQTPIQNIGMQIEWYEELKIAMNKLLLPRDSNNGWNVVEEEIYRKLGLLSKQIASGLEIDNNEKYFIFSADVILNEKVKPFICDINGEVYLPNEKSLKHFLKLIYCHSCTNFVQIE